MRISREAHREYCADTSGENQAVFVSARLRLIWL